MKLSGHIGVQAVSVATESPSGHLTLASQSVSQSVSYAHYIRVDDSRGRNEIATIFREL
jgi:hypothetical protein